MRIAVLLSGTFFVTALAGPPRADLAPRDGRPASYAETSRTFSIGDLHGDVHAFYRICLGLRLCDPGFHWTGGDAQLVLVGDLQDGAETTGDLIDATARLHLEARQKGGGVYRLGGNHEMLAARGDGTYMETADAVAFAPRIAHFFTPTVGLSPRKTALEIFAATFSDPRSRYARDIAHRNTFLKIGRRIFVHAGVHDMWPKEAWEADLETLNSTVRRELLRLQRRERYSAESAEHWIVEADGFGPLWTRSLAYEMLPDSVLPQFLQRHGADTLIVGHTSVASGRPEPRYQKHLWLTDTKISSAYGGHLSALEFRDQATVPVLHTDFPPGTAPQVPLPCGAELDETLW